MEATARTTEALGFLTKEATQRLLRDWKEVQKEPIHTIIAKPLETNLREWHCNLIPDDGPYRGTAFHLVLTFPCDYPNHPPDVQVCTFLSHPNVFDKSVCLDMIKDPEYYARPYRGWSTAYSVQSVLLQLQSFLFAENVPQGFGGADIVNRAQTSEVISAKSEAAAFHCSGCGFKGSEHGAGEGPMLPQKGSTDVLDGSSARHVLDESSDGGRVVPTKEIKSSKRVADSAQTSPKQFSDATAEAPPKLQQTEAKKHAQAERAADPNPPTLVDRLSELPTDVLVEVMDRLDASALSALLRASRRFARAAAERGAWVRRELQCFHSKRSFGEEVLGFGIATKRAECPDRWQKIRGYCSCQACQAERLMRMPPIAGGRWQGVLSMDYLSAGAFFEGNVCRGVWNERLEWWLPLILDDQHCARALPLLKGTIAALAANPPRPALSRDWILRQPFSPLDTLKVLPRLMNGMIVSFMNQENARNEVDLHASEKALLSYCQLHHMLLRLAQEYPVLQAAIDRALSRFQSMPAARHKGETPDLGELLVLLGVATTGGVTWDSLAPAFMAETFDRNVLWLLREHPELAVLEAADSLSAHRLVTTFNARATSRRLVMFQVAFLLLVRPSGASVGDVLADYAQRYGYPRPGLTRELQQIWYRVCQVATWPAFFAQLGLPCPSDLELCTMLRQAVISSSAKGYTLSNSCAAVGAGLALPRCGSDWSPVCASARA